MPVDSLVFKGDVEATNSWKEALLYKCWCFWACQMACVSAALPYVLPLSSHLQQQQLKQQPASQAAVAPVSDTVAVADRSQHTFAEGLQLCRRC